MLTNRYSFKIILLRRGIVILCVLVIFIFNAPCQGSDVLATLEHVNPRANNESLNLTVETNTLKVGNIREGFPAFNLISSPIFKIWKNVSM